MLHVNTPAPLDAGLTITVKLSRKVIKSGKPLHLVVNIEDESGKEEGHPGDRRTPSSRASLRISTDDSEYVGPAPGPATPASALGGRDGGQAGRFPGHMYEWMDCYSVQVQGQLAHEGPTSIPAAARYALGIPQRDVPTMLREYTFPPRHGSCPPLSAVHTHAAVLHPFRPLSAGPSSEIETADVAMESTGGQGSSVPGNDAQGDGEERDNKRKRGE